MRISSIHQNQMELFGLYKVGIANANKLLYVSDREGLQLVWPFDTYYIIVFLITFDVLCLYCLTVATILMFETNFGNHERFIL